MLRKTADLFGDMAAQKLEPMYVHLENRQLASLPPKTAGIDHSFPRGMNMHTPVPSTEMHKPSMQLHKVCTRGSDVEPKKCGHRRFWRFVNFFLAIYIHTRTSDNRSVVLAKSSYIS